MKRFTLLKTMLLLCALIVGSGSAWAAQSVVISSTPPTTTTWTWFGTNRVTWNASVTWGTSGAPSSNTSTNGYYQMGTQANPASSIQFSTNDVVGRISSIVVNCASYNGIGSISATVGGEAFGTQNQSITKWSSSKGGDATFTKDGGATGSIVITMTNGDGGRAMYIKSITVNYIAEASMSFPVEEFTETATIKSDGTAESDGSYITTSTSESPSSTVKFGYSYGLKLESKAGIITIALPANATNAYVSLLNSNESTSLKLAGTTTNVTCTGNAENGYINTINIPDSYAGSNFTIQKGSVTATIYKITLTYCLPSESKVLLYSSSNLEGWRTFYDESQGYTPDANTKVYVVTSKGESTASLSEIDRIPSGTPVLLKTSATISDDGVFKIALTKATVSEYTGTNLLAVTDGTDVTSKYRLGYNSSDGIGFYPYSAATPAVGIVYLDASSVASTRSLTLDFGESETTGINETERVRYVENKIFYNLNGQRVAQPTKGLYIVNGKKVLIK